MFLILFATFSCSGHEQSEHDRLRAQNAKGEYIYRNHDERQYSVKEPISRSQEPYPWEICTDVSEKN